jgi:hypothetical protein
MKSSRYPPHQIAPLKSLKIIATIDFASLPSTEYWNAKKSGSKISSVVFCVIDCFRTSREGKFRARAISVTRRGGKQSILFSNFFSFPHPKLKEWLNVESFSFSPLSGWGKIEIYARMPKSKLATEKFLQLSM